VRFSPGVSPCLSPAGKLPLAPSPLAPDSTSPGDRSRSSHPALTFPESRGGSGFSSRSALAGRDTAEEGRLAEIFPSGWPKCPLRTGSGAGAPSAVLAALGRLCLRSLFTPRTANVTSTQLQCFAVNIFCPRSITSINCPNKLRYSVRNAM